MGAVPHVRAGSRPAAGTIPAAAPAGGIGNPAGLARDARVAPPIHSAVYAGRVRHRRHAPHPHAFEYDLCMLYLDLDEIEQVFAGRWLWSVCGRNVAEFRRSDYLGDPSIALDVAVRDLVEQRSGVRPSGAIRMLTHLRYFGHVFNPVTFYYCFAADGAMLQAIVAEITNTPWKERHAYVLPMAGATVGDGDPTWRFDKQFHVSPFMAMAHTYAWRFSTPGEALRVHMAVLPPRTGAGTEASATATAALPQRKQFDATLTLQRLPADGAGLARVLWRYPFMTLRVVAAIHWQALRIWLRRNPVHPHPSPRVDPP